MFMICSNCISSVRLMPARLYFPGFQPNPELDRMFFAVRVGAENAVSVVQLCDRLCHQNGLRGRRIAADLLHITLRGVGAYDGLPNFIVERAREAGPAVSTPPFPLTFDRVMSFNGGRGSGLLSCVLHTISRDCSSFISCLVKR